MLGISQPIETTWSHTVLMLLPLFAWMGSVWSVIKYDYQWYMFSYWVLWVLTMSNWVAEYPMSDEFMNFWWIKHRQNICKLSPFAFYSQQANKVKLSIIINITLCRINKIYRFELVLSSFFFQKLFYVSLIISDKSSRSSNRKISSFTSFRLLSTAIGRKKY